MEFDDNYFSGESDEETEEQEVCAETTKRNYDMAGEIVGEEKDEISLSQNMNLLKDNVHCALQEVLSEVRLPFQLADFQKLSLHVMGSRQNLVLISPTGSGKMIIVWLGSLLMRKIYQCPRGVSIGTQPLTLIMEEKISNCLVPTGLISMRGDMRHNQQDEENIDLSNPEEDFLSGNLPVLIGHPESWASDRGQMLVRKLQKQKMILMQFVDEFHQGLPNHWSSIRPEMIHVAGRMRIFSEKGAPTVAMSATATEGEVSDIIAKLGLRSPPVILRASPIQDHTKYVILQRPPNSCGPFGREDKSGTFHPGLLQLLDKIYIGKYVDSIQSGITPKKCIIFCKSEHHMLDTYEFIKEKLPHFTPSTSPFVMNHAGLGNVTAQDIINRRNEISLFISTSKMLMGVDLLDIDIIIFVRPQNMLHNLIQGAGRAGRRTLDGRRRVLVYVLTNASDIAANVPGMDNAVRFLCTTNNCLKVMLREYFDGKPSQSKTPEWCCSYCDKGI